MGKDRNRGDSAAIKHGLSGWHCKGRGKHLAGGDRYRDREKSVKASHILVWKMQRKIHINAVRRESRVLQRGVMGATFIRWFGQRDLMKTGSLQSKVQRPQGRSTGPGKRKGGS